MENIFRESVQAYLADKNIDELKKLLQQAEEVELLGVITELSSEDMVIFYRLLSKEKALFVFEALDTTSQQTLLASFTDENASHTMEELSPDVRVQLLEELPATVARRLIFNLSPEERAITNTLMGYDFETAGRVMTTEYIALKAHMTVQESLLRIRQTAKEMETIYILYVTNQARKLEGVLSLKDLILAEPEDRIEQLMIKSVVKVSTDMNQEEVARTLQKFDLLAVPVVDTEERLVGIITVDDAMDIIDEEVTEDVLDSSGISDIHAQESSRSEILVHGSLWQIWKLRLPFLVFTIIAGILAGIVIDGFEEVLESVVIVAVFIPIIMDMGGNVGTQSSAVFTRGMILGHIKMTQVGKSLLKEVGVGFSMGLVIGVVTGVIAYVWHGIPQLGIAVGLSLMFVVTLASFLGFLVPFVLVRLKIDQASGTGPIITSIKDVTGLLVYFGLVSLFLGYMLY